MEQFNSLLSNPSHIYKIKQNLIYPVIEGFWKPDHNFGLNVLRCLSTRLQQHASAFFSIKV